MSVAKLVPFSGFPAYYFSIGLENFHIENVWLSSLSILYSFMTTVDSLQTRHTRLSFMSTKENNLSTFFLKNCTFSINFSLLRWHHFKWSFLRIKVY
jgi:hypothetical protein